MSDNNWWYSAGAGAAGRKNRPARKWMLAIPVLLAAVCWAAGKHGMAVVIAGTGLLVFLAELATGRAVSLLIYSGRLFADCVSRMVLTLVYFVIFMPVHGFYLLTGTDPMRYKNKSGSLWLARHTEKIDLKHQFLMEKDYRNKNSGPIWPAGLIAVMVVLVLFLAVIEGAGRLARMVFPSTWTLGLSTAPYGGADWVTDYFREFQQSSRMQYAPYRMWHRREYHGKYVNTDTSGRRTYQGKISDRPRIRIWCFGGSAMWGTGSRDDYTIPSCLARCGEEHGLNLAVRNYGEAGFVNRQELIDLVLRLMEGEKPDMAVFYDGPNDIYAASQGEPAGYPQNNTLLRDIYEGRLSGIIQQWLKKSEAFNIAIFYFDRAFNKLRYRPVEQSQTQSAVNCRESIEKDIALLERIGKEQGFECACFLQPNIFVGKPLHPAETAVAAQYPGSYRILTLQFYRQLRQTAGIIDLSRVFADVKEPVYIDPVHTAENGNMIIARAIYNNIFPELKKIVRNNASKVKK